MAQSGKMMVGLSGLKSDACLQSCVCLCVFDRIIVVMVTKEGIG